MFAGGYTEKDFIGKEGLSKSDLNWTHISK